MIDNGMKMDRDTYIAVNWGHVPDEEWTAEHEAELPRPFQKR